MLNWETENLAHHRGDWEAFLFKCLETEVTLLSIQCRHVPLPKTQVNSGESNKGLKFQLYPMAGTHFQTHSVLR